VFGGRELVTKIDKNFMTTYAKVATHDGDDEPIQIWAKDAKSYGGVGSDKLGIWGSVVGVDFDICVADGACVDACPVDVFDWIDTPNHPASDKKAIGAREPDCIVCRACEEVCPVDAILITDPADIGSDTSPAEEVEEKEETPASAGLVSDPISAGSVINIASTGHTSSQALQTMQSGSRAPIAFLSEAG
jgi:NAD-dependent dihydropyrimidine dehydrogenase PreA subunit